MVRFFIDRPIFAAVLSILITLAGGLAVGTLPLTQYPAVTPPTIQVDCNYPGAGAKTVAETIAAPIEQQVNGVEGMLYMTSQSTSDGSYTLTVTFQIGTDLNLAQVLVLNRVSLAQPNLPDVVRATGVTTRKRSSEILMTVALTSPPEPGFPDGRYDQLYLSNYAVLRLKDELQRVRGISDVTIFGQKDYSMRVWVDPQKLAARGLSSVDVVTALREQNAQVAAGQVGQPPSGGGQVLQFTIDTLGRLVDVEQFENVVLKASAGGGVVRIRDVARVELGARSQDVANRFDRKGTVGLAVFLLPDANALDIAEAVKAKMAEMSQEFPPGVEYEIGYDTSPFIRESIYEVFKALRDAILLVAVVVLVFLQSWRAAVIPLAAVPVAIVGTFAAMAAVGFSLNNLTLFGLVLAVGIVVDDAIVIVEAVQHHIEKGLTPKAATVKAMEEVTGPVVAVGVVLAAVFIPCAFLSGIVGQFFRQFALTIAISTLISAFSSLTLSPALCALLLRPADGRRAPLPRAAYPLLGAVLGYLLTAKILPLAAKLSPAAGAWLAGPGATYAHFVAAGVGAVAVLALSWALNPLLNAFFWLFNRGFDRAGRGYVWVTGGLVRGPVTVGVLAAYGGLILTGFEIARTQPTGFIPSQDKGYMIASVQLPDSASAERCQAVMDRCAEIALAYTVELPAAAGDEGAEPVEKDGETRWARKVKPVRHCNAVAGNSFVLSSYGSNFGSMFIILDGFDERRHPLLYADAVAAGLRARYERGIPEARVDVFGAPAVSGLGRAGGFRLMVEDRGEVGTEVLQDQTDALIRKANDRPELVKLFTAFKARAPQIYLDVDRVACQTHGLALHDVFGALQASMGQRYVNDFNRFGRTWQVNVQAETHFRDELEDIKRIKVRNKHGEMVPLGTVLTAKQVGGPQSITRYNMYPAATVNGNVAPGVSSGVATKVLEDLCERELPQGMTGEWTELTFIERNAGKTKVEVPGVFRVFVNTTLLVFTTSVVAAFLILAALYESWSLPLAVILVVPVCVVASLIGLWLTDPGSAHQTLTAWGVTPDGFGGRLLAAAGWLDGRVVEPVGKAVAGSGLGKQDVNIFTQVGFVVLIGLTCKNAILIVEFAAVKRAAGMDRRAAVLEACRLRFRPILMTSAAFILGVVPLLTATGAGAEMRRALGLAVFSGMIGVTAFGIFFTPVFFVLVDRLGGAVAVALPKPVRDVSDAVLAALALRFVPPLTARAAAAATAKVRALVRK